MLAMSEFCWHRIEIARLMVVGMQEIEINYRDLIWSRSRTIPDVARWRGEERLFLAMRLAVTCFILHKQANRRWFGLEVTAADQHRVIRVGRLNVGWTPRQGQIWARCSYAARVGCAARTFFHFLFFFRLPTDRGTSLCSKEGRSKAVEEWPDKNIAWLKSLRIFLLYSDIRFHWFVSNNIIK